MLHLQYLICASLLLLSVSSALRCASVRCTYNVLQAAHVFHDPRGNVVVYDPKSSKFYDPALSSTYKYVANEPFHLAYGDGSVLNGHSGEDVVELGGFGALSKFGAVTYCNSPDFDGVSGILGFGTPTPGSLGSRPQPLPLLFVLTGGDIDHVPPVEPGSNLLPVRAFSFHAKENAAELQLGGYDPASVEGTMSVFPTVMPTQYMAPAHGVRFGNTQLFRWSNPNITTTNAFFPALLDSGSSCLVIPDSVQDGTFTVSPYQLWLSLVKDTENPASKESFFVNLDGTEYEIPFDVWYVKAVQQSCVQQTPEGFPGIILGDVLFRTHVVMFDLTLFPETILLGIAKQNPAYRLPSTLKPSGDPPAPTKISKVLPPNYQSYKAPIARSRVPVRNFQDSQFFVNVSVGTPPQTLEVVFDTGSSLFGVFSACEPGPSLPVDSPCIFGCVRPAVDGQCTTPQRGTSLIIYAVVVAGFLLVGFIAHASYSSLSRRVSDHDKMKAYRQPGSMYGAIPTSSAL